MATTESHRGALAEIITIYRKMKKGREMPHVYKIRKDQVMDTTAEVVSETIRSTPMIKNTERDDSAQMTFNFSPLNGLNPSGSKYMFYSKGSGLVQTQVLENISAGYSDMLKNNFFWLNIFNPTDADLQSLGNMFDLHELTMQDIKEGNTDEKIEVFKHYTFISMKLLVEADPTNDDVDFNILVFKDFVLTFHDKPWISVQDTFNFIELLSKHTSLTPSWVLYSIIIEFMQDIKYLVDGCILESVKIQEISKNFKEAEMASILKRTFHVSCQINSLLITVRYKIEILKIIRDRCRNRIVALVRRYMSEAIEDLRDLSKKLMELLRGLERSQDTYLALLNVAQTQEGNEMNKSMSRMSLAALIISPCQLLSGIWGMNVKVPGQTIDSLYPFFTIVICSFLPFLIYFYNPIRRFIYKRTKK
ncbi:magnesium transporter [Nematocida major]|uniref:magnesium transporter n=1 Tax=Nematocida major TaxID=1912982 RepID=UPI00200764C6|nr:magnesium transporter [Nematocida major]KAH9387212.1 magnesium transporter [Nematocida major]